MNSNKLQTDFINYLITGDFESAESLIAGDIFDVEDQMDSLGEEDFKKFESHWSAVNTGELISTPFFVLKEISDVLCFKKDSKLIDLGSGHGGPSLVFSALNPRMEITGYEIVLEKVNGSIVSAKRLGLKNLSFIQQDLSDENFQLPMADYYYSFNPVNEDVAEFLALQLLAISKSKDIKIICSDEGMDNKAFKKVGFKPTNQTITKWGIEVLD